MSLRRVLLVGTATTALALVAPPSDLAHAHVQKLMEKPINEAAAQPREIVNSMDSKLAALKAYMLKSQRENEQALKVKATEYAKKLAEQGNQTRQIEANIEQLYGKILSQQNMNNLTRDSANELRESTRLLVQNIHSIEMNLSFAHEFAHSTLENMENALVSEKVKILGELDQNDETRRVESEHKRNLESVAKGHGVLLQIGAAVDDGADLVTSLQSSLGDLSTTQSGSFERLNASFSEQFEAGKAKQILLLKEKARLEGELQREESLGNELKDAVKLLTETKAVLETRNRGLVSFLTVWVA